MTGAVGTASLGRRALTGAVWNYAAFVANRGVVFASTVVLARLLEPADFGLMALGLLVLRYLETLNEFGVGAAVVYEGTDDPRRDPVADVAFTVSLALGLGFGALGVLSAPVVADLLGEPRLTGVLVALSSIHVIASFSQVQAGKLRRLLAFRRRVGPELARSVAKAVVTIALAAAGAGVWALVWGQITSTLVAAVAYWVACPWKPRPAFDGSVAGRICRFGGSIAAVGLVGSLHKNVDYLAVGHRLGAGALGVYTLAFRLPELALISLTGVIGQVLFPVLRRVAADPARLRAGIVDAVSATAVVAVPLGAGLAVTAPVLVEVVYGDRWAAAAAPLRILAVYAVVLALGYNFGDAYKAIGRPGILTATSLTQLVLSVPVLWWAADRGITAVAWAQLGLISAMAVVRLTIVRMVAGVRPSELARAVTPVAAAAVVLVGAGALAGSLTGGAAPAGRLAAMTAAGAAGYAAGLAVFGQGLLARLRARIGPARPGDDDPHPPRGGRVSPRGADGPGGPSAAPVAPDGPFVVLGMHKSGTTLVAQMLAASGVDMGVTDGRSYDEGNQRERPSTLAVNDALLGSDGRQSIRIRPPRHLKVPPGLRERMRRTVAEAAAAAGGRPWGFKDPRTCLTYPAWAEVLGPHRVVVVYRDPAGVALRYRRWAPRWRWPATAAAALVAWVEHNRRILEVIDGGTVPVCVLDYRALMTSDAEMDRLARFVGRTLVDVRRPELWRHRRPPGATRALLGALTPWVVARTGRRPGSVLRDLEEARRRQLAADDMWAPADRGGASRRAPGADRAGGDGP